MKYISFFGDGVIIPISLVLVIAFFISLKDKKIAAALVGAALFGEVLKQVLKEIIKRPRPESFGCRLLVSPSGYSMPSGHTIFYTIFFGLIFYFLKRYYWGKWWGQLAGIFSLIMVFLIGFSRVYLGAHWFSDIVVGYILGGIILFTTIKFLQK